jgi:hypothetical protein
VKRTALAFLLLSVCFLAACSSGADKYIRIGQDLLRAYAMQPGLEYNLYRRVTWDEGDRVVGTLDDEAFPDWARGAFSACVRWEERFHRDIANPEAGPGEPTQIRQTGHAAGWILVGEDMRYHILELTVTFDGQTFDWIRAWDPPE